MGKRASSLRQNCRTKHPKRRRPRVDNNSHLRESGTFGSGYGEEGPYHCEDCIHKPASDAEYCNHPLVVSDPDLQGRVVEMDGQKLVQINLKKGCCRFVKPP